MAKTKEKPNRFSRYGRAFDARPSGRTRFGWDDPRDSLQRRETQNNRSLRQVHLRREGGFASRTRSLVILAVFRNYGEPCQGDQKNNDG